MREREHLWHTARCDIQLRMQLRHTIEQLEVLDEQPHLPGADFEALHAQQRTDLENLRDNLLTRLTAGTTAPPTHMYDGESKITHRSKPRKQGST
jgi:hypothetical protein